MPSATAYTFVPAPEHEYPGHPEAPSRFDVLARWLSSSAAQRLPAREAAPEEITRVHRVGLLQELERAARQGPIIIDPAPTYVTRSSLQDALLAAGATVECTRAVARGDANNAFAIVRPPGHHAEPTRAMGFCLFNNAAIAACDALESGMQRVAIVDFDVHHGNGTQAAFLKEPRIAYLSTHQWGIYPGTGWYTDAPEARRRIVNVPLPERSGDRAFARITAMIVEPFLRGFRPELVIVSAGFDAHWNDPLASLGLSTSGFHTLSMKLVELAGELCQGRIVFVMEGGYDATNLSNGVAAVFAALEGSAPPAVADAMPYAEPDVATAQLEKIRAWHGFQV